MKPIFTYILIIVLIVGAAIFADEYLAIPSEGMTIDSVSTNIPVTSNTLTKNIDYLIGATLNGGGQSVDATIYDYFINEKTETNADYNFNLNIETTDETIHYPIHNTGQNIYKYTLKIKEPGACSVAADFKIPLGYERHFPYYDWLQVKEICVYKIVDATVGELDNPTVENSATISVSSTKDNKVYTKTINTITQQSVTFNDYYSNQLVKAYWTGSLVTGNPTPSPHPYVATYISPIATWSTKNIWTLSSRTELTNYNKIESNVDSKLRDMQNFPKDFECSSIESCTTLIKSELDLVNDARKTLIGGTTARIGAAQTFVNRDDFNNGEVSIVLDRNINYMKVNFIINADWLGISIPTGQPKILSVNCPEFSSGDSSGLCELNVKNVGTGTGTFVASMTKGGIFTQKYSSPKQTFTAGESQIMRIYIDHGYYTQDIVETATFKVYDYNNPDAFDVLISTISMTEPQKCVPGTIRPSGLNVYECRADGSGEDIILSCPSGTVLIKDVNDEWICSEPLNGKPPVEKPSFSSKLIDEIMDKLFGEEFGVDDIIPAIIMILIGIVVLYLFLLLIPIILPMLGKALIGLILRK